MSIDKFNREHRWRKRGIAMVPTKFGIAFTALFLNQAGALIHIYSDGSILLSHGGTEMGKIIEFNASERIVIIVALLFFEYCPFIL